MTLRQSALLSLISTHFANRPTTGVLVWGTHEALYSWRAPHHIDVPLGPLTDEVGKAARDTLRSLGCPAIQARQGLVAWNDDKGLHLHLYHSRLGDPTVKDHAADLPLGEDESYRVGYPVTEQWKWTPAGWQEVGRHAHTHEEGWDPVVTLPAGVPKGAEGFVNKAMTDALTFPEFTASWVKRVGLKVEPSPPVAMPQVDDLFVPRRRRP